MPKHIPVDESLFDQFDEEWKIYYLSWVLTDGNMINNTIRIMVTSTDSEILDYFNDKIFEGKKMIYIHKPRISKWKDGRDTLSREAKSLVVQNKAITNRFREMGITENKSFTVTMPNIPPKFMGAFFRGAIEGDGWVCYNPVKKNKRIGICSGSLIFIQQMSKILDDIGIKNTIESSKKGQHRFSIGDYDSIKKFYDFIYKDAEFWLKRKRDKFEEILSNRINVKGPRSSQHMGIGFQKNATGKKWFLKITLKSKKYFETEELALLYKQQLLWSGHIFGYGGI